MDEPEIKPDVDDLRESIAALAATSVGARQIADDLGFRLKDLGENLRDYRRQFALAMFGKLAPEIYNRTKRYYDLLDRTLTAMEALPIETMDPKWVMRLHDSLLRWVTPVNQGIVLAPRDSGVEAWEGKALRIPGRPDVSMTQILTIVEKRHQIPMSEKTLKSRRKTLKNFALPPGEIPNEQPRPPEPDERSSTFEETVPESSEISPDEALGVLRDLRKHAQVPPPAAQTWLLPEPSQDT